MKAKFCRYCGEEKLYFKHHACESCWNERTDGTRIQNLYSEKIKNLSPKRFCIYCGYSFPLIQKVFKEDRIRDVSTSFSFRDCPICKERKRKFCFCGKEVFGNKTYCEPCSKEKYKERHNFAARRWQKKNYLLVRSQNFTKIHSDKLIIHYECPCNYPKKHNHHIEYTRPFEILKLCPTCHREWHKKLRINSQGATA